MHHFSIRAAGVRQREIARFNAGNVTARNGRLICGVSQPNAARRFIAPGEVLRQSLLGFSLFGFSLLGCDAPREPNRIDVATDKVPEQTLLDTSPALESPISSSGITHEAPTHTALDRVAANEQLKKTVNPEADTIWGDWAIDAATLNGEPMPSDAAASISLYIDATNYVANIGKQVDRGTILVRRQAIPMELDITGVDGPNAGKTILAIFEQPDVNSLVVCYSFNEAERPKDFSSTAENGQFLVKYKRKALN